MRSSLGQQAMHLSGVVNKEILGLQALKDKSSEAGLNSQDKINNLKAFKNSVFASAFNQIYAIRLANIISIITLSQTGKKYFQNTISL